MPLRQTVKSCTINPARAIGVDSVTGSIALGKRADLTVLSSDLTELRCVYIKGKGHKKYANRSLCGII